MNVILLERFGNLGDLGEEVVVKAGFARNFLIPQGKAVRAPQPKWLRSPRSLRKAKWLQNQTSSRGRLQIRIRNLKR